VELVIRSRAGATPGDQPVEVVERKGLGHPDTLCDAIAEHICVELCRYYLEHFGAVLHHNVDKILLVGGAARPAFGAGEVTEPIEIYLGGRATAQHGGRSIPIHDIAIGACRARLRSHLRALDVEQHVRVVSRLRPGSSDLNDVFTRGARAALANDTSCGAGFAPLTDLERTVLAVERALNDPGTKLAHPAIGEDIKVMGVRSRGRTQLSIGCALIGRHLRDLAEYASTKQQVCALALAAASKASPLPVQVRVNVADDLERGHVFLTVTGTSAEAGDDGQVGRGNRVGGLITPYRAMTLEAAAGKNPVSHVGKLYNVAAARIAAAVVQQAEGILDASCVLFSAIGQPIDQPDIVDIALIGQGVDAKQTTIREIVTASLEQLSALRDELLTERWPLY
jgi:S-adenosylmethionine synthetase